MSDPIIDAQLEQLIAEFARSGARELHIRSSGFELYLSTDASSPGLAKSATTAAPVASAPVLAAPPSPPRLAPAPQQASDVPADAIIVRAPNLGTFYRSPKPGAAFYVEIGDSVAVGGDLCLIEVMKLFTAVRADTAGRVHAVLAQDGEMVESGQPLFAIVRD